MMKSMISSRLGMSRRSGVAIRMWGGLFERSSIPDRKRAVCHRQRALLQNQVASEARKEVHDEGAPDSNPSIAASDNIGANNDNGSGGNAADNKSDSDHEDIGNEGGGDEEGCSPVGEDKESIDGNREQDKENGRSDDDDSIGDDDAVQ
ncbi:hypothetical protein AAF712_013869 [Marasmius tenuissimus]|uniref:Uncharacterized protein n=1 Tax=Marasmius tenuissimus TaxID=585030 RepID=A0ABR2ZCL5_9AGAR